LRSCFFLLQIPLRFAIENRLFLGIEKPSYSGPSGQGASGADEGREPGGGHPPFPPTDQPHRGMARSWVTKQHGAALLAARPLKQIHQIPATAAGPRAAGGFSIGQQAASVGASARAIAPAALATGEVRGGPLAGGRPAQPPPRQSHSRA